MMLLFRVRYMLPLEIQSEFRETRTADHPGPLSELSDRLPPGAYVLSIENLREARSVHWTRWPDMIRPGFKDRSTGKMVI